MFCRFGAMESAQCFQVLLSIIVGFISVITYFLLACPLHGLLSMIKNIERKSFWQILSFMK